MTFFTGIIEGGAAFLNFVVEFVVFITALYYLLGEYCDTVLILLNLPDLLEDPVTPIP